MKTERDTLNHRDNTSEMCLGDRVLHLAGRMSFWDVGARGMDVGIRASSGM